MNDKQHLKIFFDTVHSNIWYVSDDGSDDNGCHSASTPCRNLQTVLNRATDGADIYVTSPTLSIDYIKKDGRCIISSSLSYTLRRFYYSTINMISSRCMYVYLLIFVYFFADSTKPLHYSSPEFPGSILDV